MKSSQLISILLYHYSAIYFLPVVRNARDNAKVFVHSYSRIVCYHFMTGGRSVWGRRAGERLWQDCFVVVSVGSWMQLSWKTLWHLPSLNCHIHNLLLSPLAHRLVGAEKWIWSELRVSVDFPPSSTRFMCGVVVGFRNATYDCLQMAHEFFLSWQCPPLWTILS